MSKQAKEKLPQLQADEKALLVDFEKKDKKRCAEKGLNAYVKDACMGLGGESLSHLIED